MERLIELMLNFWLHFDFYLSKYDYCTYKVLHLDEDSRGNSLLSCGSWNGSQPSAASNSIYLFQLNSHFHALSLSVSLWLSNLLSQSNLSSFHFVTRNTFADERIYVQYETIEHSHHTKTHFIQNERKHTMIVVRQTKHPNPSDK